jgi:hypothetical protein
MVRVKREQAIAEREGFRSEPMVTTDRRFLSCCYRKAKSARSVAELLPAGDDLGLELPIWGVELSWSTFCGEPLMNSPSLPAKLPEAYRAKPAISPKRLQDAGTDGEFYISDMAVKIDATWGVWLDPNALVSETRSQESSVMIYGTPGGYSVDLARSGKKVWIASTTDSFAGQGFIPAFSVIEPGQLIGD